MSKTFKCLPVLIFMLLSGCGLFGPSSEDISEITFRGQTGLFGSAYTVTFLSDGTANCECSS